MLQNKAFFDKRAQELAAQPQEDPLVYRKLIEVPLWSRTIHAVEEMLNSESRSTYYNLKSLIRELKDVETPEQIQAQRTEFVFEPATQDGRKVFNAIKNGQNLKTISSSSNRASQRKMNKILPKNTPPAKPEPA